MRFSIWKVILLCIVLGGCLLVAITLLFGSRVDEVFLGPITVEQRRDLQPVEISPTLLLPGAQVISATVEARRELSGTTETGYTQEMLQLRTSLPPDQILNHYRTVLKADGWSFRCTPRPVDTPLPSTFNMDCGVPSFSSEWNAHAIYRMAKASFGWKQINLIVGRPKGLESERVVKVLSIDVNSVTMCRGFR